MTVCGLISLHENVRPDELVILFHSNHFSVLQKRLPSETDESIPVDSSQGSDGGSLFELVTDIRIIDEQPLLVWSRLGNTDNDLLFVDAFDRLPHASAQQAAREFNSQRHRTHDEAVHRYFEQVQIAAVEFVHDFLRL